MDLTIWQTVLVVSLVSLAGFIDSIAGGGGLISLPSYFAAGLPPHMALATNKFSGFCGTSTAVYRYWRAGRIRIAPGLIAAVGAIIGAAIGAKIALYVSESTVRLVLLVLVPVALVVFLAEKKLPKFSVPSSKNNTEMPLAFLIGAIIGTYDGFFGPATGAFLAIGFHVVLRYDLVTASANARLANLASNAGGLMVFLLSAKVVFPLAFYTAAGGIIGNQLGSRLAIKGGERIVRPVLILVMVILLAEVARRQIISS